MTERNDIGLKIKARRKALGLTLQDVAEKVGTTASTLRKWEEGMIGTVKSSKISALSRALDTTPGYLMGWEDDPAMYKNVERIEETKRIPIIGRVSAGAPILAEATWDEEVAVPGTVLADFAVRVSGDSMINARLFDGDLVFIREQNQVNDGEIAAVLIGGEVVLKRVYCHRDRLELRPENPLYESLNYDGPDLDQIRILGRAMALLGDVR